MGKYLDFENEKHELGYRSFNPTKENVKKHIGDKICFVTTRDIDKHRGTYFVRYSRIHSMRYNSLFLGEAGFTSINVRDILDIGVEIK